MEIGAVVVLKFPRDRVWTLMRDELERVIVPDDGIRELVIEQRAAAACGGVQVRSLWQADVAVPTLAAPYVDPDLFRWRDEALWDEAHHACRWRVTSLQLGDRIECAGTTVYEPAMGGRGTRITMTGTFRWNLRGVVDVPVGLEAAVSRGIEGFIGSLIPRNFRRVADAARRHLENGGVG